MCLYAIPGVDNLRPVSMANMAFIIPLERVTMEWRRRVRIHFNRPLPFIHNFNAEFSYAPISNWHDGRIPQPRRMYYNSQYDGHNNIERAVNIYPYLLRYTIGKCHTSGYALVYVAVLDKIFDNQSSPLTPADYCTPFDIVYLKRAFFERGEYELHTLPNGQGIGIHDIIDAEVIELGGIINPRDRQQHHYPRASVVNLTVLTLPDLNFVDFNHLTDIFTQNYYNTVFSMREFLDIDIMGWIRPPLSGYHDMSRFAYGLLHGNNNFMRADDSAVEEATGIFYSNNYVERYFAVRDNIVSIRVASPFDTLAADQRRRILTGSVDSVECLRETFMLLVINAEMERLNSSQSGMDYEQIETCRATIAEYFHNSIFNQNEMDNRLQFFMNRFGLRERNRDIQDIAIPRRNVLERHFTLVVGVLTIVIGLLSAVITALTK